MGGYRVQTVRGTVRTLGQSRVHMSGLLHSFIKFDLDGGGTFMPERVAVLNSVGSELEPGVSGTFHVVGNGKASAVVAFEGTDGRTGDDVAAFVKSVRGGTIGTAFLMVAACAVLSGFAGLLLMAMFRHAPFAFWLAFYLLPPALIVWGLMRRIPTEAEIRAAIAGSDAVAPTAA